MAKFIEVSTYNLEGILQKVLINIDNICVIMPHDGNDKQTFISTNDFSCICNESIDIVRNMLTETNNVIVNNKYGKYEKVDSYFRLVPANSITNAEFANLANEFLAAHNSVDFDDKTSDGELMKSAYKKLFESNVTNRLKEIKELLNE